MNEQEIILKTVDFVKEKLQNAEAGHDWFHIERVWKLSKKIAETEESNLLVVELAALLHDIADSKFNDGDELIGPAIASSFLTSLLIDEKIIKEVRQIILNISFKGGNFNQTYSSSELSIVQDADRLDAMGAIGVARAFNYGGFKNRPLYDPDISPNLQMDKEAYKKSTAPTLNHFYEKLFLLKDKMNTKTGRILAEERHNFLEQFVNQFLKEWNP